MTKEDRKDNRVRVRLARDVVQRALDSSVANSRNLQDEVNFILRTHFNAELRPMPGLVRRIGSSIL